MPALAKVPAEGEGELVSLNLGIGFEEATLILQDGACVSIPVCFVQQNKEITIKASGQLVSGNGDFNITLQIVPVGVVTPEAEPVHQLALEKDNSVWAKDSTFMYDDALLSLHSVALCSFCNADYITIKLVCKDNEEQHTEEQHTYYVPLHGPNACKFMPF